MASKTWLIASVFLTLTTHVAYATSRDHHYSLCFRKGNYTSESLYGADLYTLLSNLSSNMGNNGFYNASLGQVHAFALCRADIKLSQCRSCVALVAKDVVRRCPFKLQAVLWRQHHCMVLYSDEPVHGSLTSNETGDAFPMSTRLDDDEIFSVRWRLIGDLRAAASGGGALRKAAAGNRTTAGDRTVYAMVQCRPDLSPEDCGSCLDNASRYLGSASSALLVYAPSCTIRYETDKVFYNVRRLQGLTAASNFPGYARPSPVTMNQTIYANHSGPASSSPSPPPPDWSTPPSPPSRPPPQWSTTPSSSPQEPSTSASSSISSSGNDQGKKNGLTITSVVISVVAFLIVALCLGFFATKKLKQKKKYNEYEILSAESIRFDYGKVKAATNGFAPDNKLGEGGFGPVYKGKNGSQEIAVKRLSQNSHQGNREFKNEVLILAKVQHNNLVRLLGFSQQGVERLLIYELVKNGSLDQIIFGDPEKSPTLDGDSRFKIIEGTARGLLYLHQDSRTKIIHRDLKASNILLDEEMNPKISDFGLAKLVVPDAANEQSSKIVGTYSYMAPEYLRDRRYSIKSDVYSFGILVLEIVSGQKKISYENENSGHLASHAYRCWRERTSASFLDPVLKDNSRGQEDMLRCIHIALLCVQENPNHRPTMSKVVLMLNGLSQTLPSPLEPAFYVPSSFSTSSAASQGQMKPSTSSDVH